MESYFYNHSMEDSQLNQSNILQLPIKKDQLILKDIDLYWRNYSIIPKRERPQDQHEVLITDSTMISKYIRANQVMSMCQDKQQTHKLIIQNFDGLLPSINSNILTDIQMYDFMLGNVLSFTNQESKNIPKPVISNSMPVLVNILVNLAKSKRSDILLGFDVDAVANKSYLIKMIYMLDKDHEIFKDAAEDFRLNIPNQTKKEDLDFLFINKKKRTKLRGHFGINKKTTEEKSKEAIEKKKKKNEIMIKRLQTKMDKLKKNGQ